MATTIPGTEAIEADLDRVAELYRFRNPDDVRAFLREHPEVVEPLLEAIEAVHRAFGPGTQLALEVERDRDAIDHAQLFALIRTDQDVDAALASLDRFNAEWWLDALQPVATTLIFGLDDA